MAEATTIWCPVCCTRHPRGSADCPGELHATGDERHGWRVGVRTPHGPRTIGVMVAPSGEVWRARILTFPNVLWAVPGGRGTKKFVGATPQEAERAAIDHVREHCREQGFRMLDHVAAGVEPTGVDRERADTARSAGGAAERAVRFLTVRFGVDRPTETGQTGDLSATGLFVVTDAPLAPGTQVELALAPPAADGVAGGTPIVARGRVRWARATYRAGRAPGMGIELIDPPARYLALVRRMAE